MKIQIQPANRSHIPILLKLIRDLAIYEKLEHEMVATADDLERTLFGKSPYAEALIATDEAIAVGFALFFHNYSTFLGRPGIYLEDLFVEPGYRGKGIGKLLLAELARLPLSRGCGRLEWSVLDWNQPAIDFYKSQGAESMSDWTVFRLDGDALRTFAMSANRSP